MVTGMLLVAPAAAAAPPVVPDPAGTNGAPVPALAWGPCPAEDPELPPDPTFDCTTATVPLDYDDVAGPTTELALKRRPTEDKAGRIGSLFLNPGGPGGSGVDFVTAAEIFFSPEILARFDIIGFDPRGIGRSEPLTCFASEQEAVEFVAFQPPFPLTEKEEQDYVTAQEAYAKGCATLGGRILQHMSTGNVARDLDLLRSAVGDEQLTFAGYSYGSQLGQTYANLFPGKVRALVIDGVLDPVGWTTGSDAQAARTVPVSTRIRSDEGSYATLQEFFRLCEQAGEQQCALAADDPETTYAELASALKDKPVDVPVGFGLFQRVGYPELVAVTMGALYAPQVWGELAALIVDLDERRDVEGAGDSYARLLAVLQGQDPVDPVDPVDPDEPSAPQTVEGFGGVACVDSDDPPMSAWPSAAATADERAPYFGRAWAWRSAPCAAWPVAVDADRYDGPWTAATANPVLVIGNRYDPATPYSGAQIAADLLPASRLLTLQGWGHTALGVSTCINAAVTAYLVAMALPAEGARCTPDVTPFTAPPLPEAGLDESGTARAAVLGTPFLMSLN
jgi:pimeloyl-ACP methyl ester carboxylesterase